jgi:hypothetical protein
MKITMLENKIKFSKMDYKNWLRCDPLLMPRKLIISTQKDIKEGRKTRPPLHHFPANVAKKYFEKKGYNVLLSEMSGDEYRLFKGDSRIEKKIGKEKYQLFLKIYHILRKNRVIRHAGGEPDLFIFNETDFFFVETKRMGPQNMVDDRLRENQKIIISIIKLFLDTDTKIYAVVSEELFDGYNPKQHSWDLNIGINCE